MHLGSGTRPTPNFNAHPSKQTNQAQDGPPVVWRPLSFDVQPRHKAKPNRDGRQNRKRKVCSKRSLSILIQMHHGDVGVAVVLSTEQKSARLPLEA